MGPAPRMEETRPPSGPVRVLVADDNPDDLVLFQRAVRNEGWTIDTAPNGAEALRIAAANPYGAVVLDYNLGDMTGTEVLLRMKERGVGAPAVIQSGLGSEFIVARALALGADGFVSKESPDYAHEVVQRVHDALRRGRRGTLGVPGPPREPVREVENVLDDLMEGHHEALLAVGFTTPDGFRVGTRFRGARNLAPEILTAMVASATSTCSFLAQGLRMGTELRLLTAEFDGGHLYAAPVPGYGVLFAAVGTTTTTGPPLMSEVQFAARELATLLETAQRREQLSP